MVSHLWLNAFMAYCIFGWGIYHLMGGDIYHLMGGHLWHKWVGQLWQSKLFHWRMQSCVSTRAKLGYAVFDAQLRKAYFVTTVYAIHTSVHA